MSYLEIFLVVHFFLLHPAEEGVYRFDNFDLSYEAAVSKTGVQVKRTNNTEVHKISCVGWDYSKVSELMNDPFKESPILLLRISGDDINTYKEIDLRALNFGRTTVHGTNKLTQFSFAKRNLVLCRE